MGNEPLPTNENIRRNFRCSLGWHDTEEVSERHVAVDPPPPDHPPYPSHNHIHVKRHKTVYPVVGFNETIFRCRRCNEKWIQRRAVHGNAETRTWWDTIQLPINGIELPEIVLPPYAVDLLTWHSVDNTTANIPFLTPLLVVDHNGYLDLYLFNGECQWLRYRKGGRVTPPTHWMRPPDVFVSHDPSEGPPEPDNV